MRRAFLLLFLLSATLSAQETGCLLEVVAGGGNSFSGDGGPATLAEFDRPEDAVARPDGSLYIADTGNGRVRRVSPDGIITTILQSRAGAHRRQPRGRPVRLRPGAAASHPAPDQRLRADGPG